MCCEQKLLHQMFLYCPYRTRLQGPLRLLDFVPRLSCRRRHRPTGQR
uniref:Succinate semialdehyde dehydrogenase n=1 Tax=Arundo donax TaxID=35708 RepID=A0A0A9EYJ5_ARUDO